MMNESEILNIKSSVFVRGGAGGGEAGGVVRSVVTNDWCITNQAA